MRMNGTCCGQDATKPAHAVPLASARQHLGVETQAGHSPERAARGGGSVRVRNRTGLQPGSCRLTGHQPNRARLRGRCGSSAGWARPTTNQGRAGYAPKRQNPGFCGSKNGVVLSELKEASTESTRIRAAFNSPCAESKPNLRSPQVRNETEKKSRS